MKNQPQPARAVRCTVWRTLHYFFVFLFLFLFSFPHLKAQVQTVSFDQAGTFSWVAPCGVTSVTVDLWGAGGGGGGAGAYSFLGTNTGAGGGGGGGAYHNVTVPVTPGTSYTVTVGAGGSAGYCIWFFGPYEFNAGDGAPSGFGGIWANGGKAGITQINDNGIGGAGAAAGTFNGGNGATGDRNSFGGGGASSAGYTAAGNNGILPLGGTAPSGGGHGGNGGNNSDGANGMVPGGGAGGAHATGANSMRNGGTGARGRVIISYSGMPTAACTPAFITVSPITNVNFAGINHSFAGTSAWEQFCYNANVLPGSTYPITISGNGDLISSDYYSVFIDWNQNGNFLDDPQYNIGSRVNTGSVSGNITVPASAPLGSTRMRVIKRRSGFASSACQQSLIGQSEDYVVSVHANANCSTPGNPTALNLSFQSTPVYAINGSFTGSGASGYLIIQTNNATPPIIPTNGILYPIGSTLLGGIVIASGTATTFTSTQVFQNTQHCYWVYAYTDNCVGGPFYSIGNTNACYTTPTCNEFATMTLTGNEVKDWNIASNWVPAIVPSACTHVTIQYTADNGNDIDMAIAHINNNFSIKSLTITGNFSNAGLFTPGVLQKEMIVQNNGHVLNIQEDLMISANNGTNQLTTGNSLNAHKVVFNNEGSSTLNVMGNTTIGGISDEQLSIFGSTTGNPKMRFWGNVTFNPYANSNPNGYYVFEKSGAAAQSLINNISTGNTSLRMLFQHVSIGEAGNSFPSLTLSGTGAAKTGINGGDLLISDSASLHLPSGTGLSQHSITAAGTLRINGSGQLYAGGSSSAATHDGNTYPGFTGNNFPANFSTYNLSAQSTVHYNSPNAVAQTIYSNVLYGNLHLSNASGAGSSVKWLQANVAGIQGNLRIDSFATLNLQQYTANRTSTGGELSVYANGSIMLGGNAGGRGPANNFPAGFSSLVLDAQSNTYYNMAGNQGIFGDVDYGNLFLSNTGNKTAAPILNLNGNFTVNGAASFVHNNGLLYFNAASNGQSIASLTPVVFHSLYNYNTHASGLQITSRQHLDSSLHLGNNSKLSLAADLALLSGPLATASVAAMPATAQIDYNGGGQFEIQRHIAQYQKWNLIGVPLSTATPVFESWQENGTPGAGNPGWGTQVTGPGGGNGLDASSVGYSLKWWNAASQSFVPVNNTHTEAVNRADGFFIYARGDRNYGPGAAGSTTTLRARGQIYTGANPPPTFIRTGMAADASIAVANPYASAIDFAGIYTKSANIKPGFSVWDPTLNGSYSVGAYQHISNTGIITPGGGLYTAANVGSSYKNIQSGQVFFVEALAPGTVSIMFDEMDKVSVSKQLNRTVQTESTVNMMSTMLHSADGILIDGNRVIYDTEYSNALAKEDASKLVNAGENFSLLRSAKKLIVEGRKPITGSDTIYYHMSGLKTQAYQLSFEPLHLSHWGVTATLVDRFSGSRIPISITDSSYYPFTITGDAASKASDRFMLVFSPATALPVHFVKIDARKNSNGTHSIYWQMALQDNVAYYQLERSTDGVSFETISRILPVSSALYSDTDIRPVNGSNYYRIKAVEHSGAYHYSDVVVLQYMDAIPKIWVSPTNRNHVVELNYQKLQPGQYSITIINSVGQGIATQEYSSTMANGKFQLALPGHVANAPYWVVLKNEGGEILFSQSIIP